MTRKVAHPLSLLAVAGLLFVGSALAQTSPPAQPATTNPTAGAGPGVDDPNHPRVNEINRREERQQQRIANGIKSGKMTPAEAAATERRDARIENQEKRDMAKHNGHLTKKEQNKLNGELNKNSRAIHKDKTQ